MERFILRAADAFFSLPDVLVLMVVQMAGQTVGRAPARAPAGSVHADGGVRSRWSAGPAPPACSATAWRRWSSRTSSPPRRRSERAGSSSSAVDLWPFLSPYLLAMFLSRVPAAILAESTVSFFCNCGDGADVAGPLPGDQLRKPAVRRGGARVVLPAWGLLVLIVLGATLAAQALGAGPRRA